MHLIGSVLLSVGGILASLTVTGTPRFSFVYDGQRHEGVDRLERMGSELYRLDTNVVVRVQSQHDAEFGTETYTVWFENVGRVPSALLKEIVCLEGDFSGADPVVRGIMGDHGQQYRPYEKRLLSKSASFEVTKGRATHGSFPYFDIVHGNGGTFLALGWCGNWKADFSGSAAGAHVRAMTNPDFAAVLLPGERVRTGQVVMLPYQGRDADHAMNLWRRWFLKRVVPKNADGSEIAPMTAVNFATDTGVKNMDGSVSERSTTWRRTFDILERERVLPDYRWVDAGWYCDPNMKNELVDWHWMGTWILDLAKWPGQSFLEAVSYCRERGVGTILWFEPETVSEPEGLVKNFGYKNEWFVGNRWVGVNDIGNPECYAWTRKKIFDAFDRMDPDIYREDFNSEPSEAWRTFDARKEAAAGLPRKGVTENLMVQAHYRLWDEIIANRRAHGRCPFVDSCSSGGGRNDIESMRRGVPLMRSDCDRNKISRRLSQTSSLCRWIPFHGSYCKESKGVLDPSSGKGPDKYVFRASLLPVCNLREDFSHNEKFDFAQLRENLAEWRSLAPFTLKDFYPLSPWHGDEDDSGWTVFAWDDPSRGESIVLAFRQEKCDKESFRVKFVFADVKSCYEIRDVDADEKRTFSGVELKDGLELRLGKPRSCKLLRIRRLDKSDAVANESRLTPTPQTLWKSGDGGIEWYRIPALCTAPNGDLVAACDARRWNASDLNARHPISISVRRSCDGGQTWSSPKTAWDWEWSDKAEWNAGDASFIVDTVANKIFLLSNVWDWTNVREKIEKYGVYRFFVQESSDNGETWSQPREISNDIAFPAWPFGKMNCEDGFIFISSGSGCQLRDGTLLHTIVHVDDGVALFGSSDHGKTWRPFGKPVKDGDECKVAELSDGRWMINSRWHVGGRMVHLSHDRGMTWQSREDKRLCDPFCNGQLMSWGAEALAFSNCNSSESRKNLCIRMSPDGGVRWSDGIVVYGGSSGYSDMTRLPSGDMGILYERDGYSKIDFAVIPRQAIERKLEGE